MTKHIPIHVVGGGIAGLVAAITAADGGAPVVLHEASDTPGGRARSGAGPYGVNLGPHVLYNNGAVVEFLRTRGLRKEVRLKLPRSAKMVVLDGDGRHSPLRIAGAVAAVVRPRRAPVDQRFDEWAHATFSARHAADLCHLAGLYTFHHDPGSLSAAFVWDGCVRSFGRFPTVRYVHGGWTTLVDALIGGARRRGVQIELGSRLEPGALPADGPVIVATAPTAAATLLERDLSWPTARTALLDVALDHPGRMPFLVMDVAPDLGGCIMAERFTATDKTLAPPGIELVQAHLGVADDVSLDDAVPRMERTLDGLGEWRSAEVWRRAHIVDGGSGAVDPPGTTWRDRPAVDQGDGRYLAGDIVAAPGLLSEVAVNSGVRAAHLALADRRQRQWAPGWPTVELSAADRAKVLAAAIPGARVTTEVRQTSRDETWATEPVAEVDAWRTRTTTRRACSHPRRRADRSRGHRRHHPHRAPPSPRPAFIVTAAQQPVRAGWAHDHRGVCRAGLPVHAPRPPTHRRAARRCGPFRAPSPRAAVATRAGQRRAPRSRPRRQGGARPPAADLARSVHRLHPGGHAAHVDAGLPSGRGRLRPRRDHR